MNKSSFLKLARRTSLLTLAAFSLTALSGCETSDDRALASGQTCLDNARTASDANQCIAAVEGLSSSESYLIRCSANFIAQGFSGQRIANAFTSVKDNPGGGSDDPMIGMMAFLIFEGSAGPLHTADKAMENCEKSGVRSMLRLATAAKLATTIAGIGSVDPTDPNAAAQMEAAVQAAITANDPTANANIGNIAIIANQAYCSAGSSYESSEVCTNLQGAVNGGGTAAQIGAALLLALQTNSGN